MSDPTDCTEPGCIAPAVYWTTATDDDWPATEGWCEAHSPGMSESMLNHDDLDNIESAAKGQSRGVPAFAHTADTLKIVAEVRRLRAVVADQAAWIVIAEEALRTVEWSVELGHGLLSCPCCLGWKSEGHRSECLVHLALTPISKGVIGVL